MHANSTAPQYVKLKEFSRYAEIKQLAFNIADLQQKKGFQSLAILSYFHGEGKTLACAALAMAYAENCGYKTLVVDTALGHSPGSLRLKDSISESEFNIDFVSIADRRKPALLGLSALARSIKAASTSIEAGNGASKLPTTMESDFSIVKRVVDEGPKQYGLVLLDTVSLTAKNKSNFDPLLIARMAGASVLVVSRKLLNASNLEQRLKLVEDPAIHLVGVISNEEFKS